MFHSPFNIIMEIYEMRIFVQCVISDLMCRKQGILDDEVFNRAPDSQGGDHPYQLGTVMGYQPLDT